MGEEELQDMTIWDAERTVDGGTLMDDLSADVCTYRY